MTKNQLATELAVSEKLCLSTACKAIDGAIRIITNALASGDEISIRGFGTLSVVLREERLARNPQTGEEIAIPAHRVVRFRAGKELLSTLN